VGPQLSLGAQGTILNHAAWPTVVHWASMTLAPSLGQNRLGRAAEAQQRDEGTGCGQGYGVYRSVPASGAVRSSPWRRVLLLFGGDVARESFAWPLRSEALMVARCRLM
jgi:hypothetical protein